MELRSKGPGRKGNLLMEVMISSPINYFSLELNIGLKGIFVLKENLAGPIKTFEGSSTVLISKVV